MLCLVNLIRKSEQKKALGLTACKVEMTGLLVEWEELEQHRAGDCEGDPREGDLSSRHITHITSSPNTIQHVAIRVNPHIEVWSENIMEPSYLLISKETVWLPDFPDIRQCQILDLICNRYSMQPCDLGQSPSSTQPDTTPAAAVLKPSFSLNCSRGSFHICLRVIWNLYSCNVSSGKINTHGIIIIKIPFSRR